MLFSKHLFKENFYGKEKVIDNSTSNYNDLDELISDNVWGAKLNWSLHLFTLAFSPPPSPSKIEIDTSPYPIVEKSYP